MAETLHPLRGFGESVDPIAYIERIMSERGLERRDLRAALDPPDKIIGRLMGHKGYREKYGDGPSLDHLQSWVSRIALLPPDPL